MHTHTHRHAHAHTTTTTRTRAHAHIHTHAHVHTDKKHTYIYTPAPKVAQGAGFPLAQVLSDYEELSAKLGDPSLGAEEMQQVMDDLERCTQQIESQNLWELGHAPLPTYGSTPLGECQAMPLPCINACVHACTHSAARMIFPPSVVST